MNIGEIKIEALKLMFTDYTDDIGVENIEDIKLDENFGRYLNSMPGAINRCFARLEEVGVVPLKGVVLSPSDGTVKFGKIKFDLTSLVDDFDKVDRVIYENEAGYNGNCSFIMETDSVIVLDNVNDDYTLIYSPALSRVTSETADTTNVELPDKVASIIPYFIKGDLFREDEPAEAADARNLFEATLDTLKARITTRQTNIETVYELGAE